MEQQPQPRQQVIPTGRKRLPGLPIESLITRLMVGHHGGKPVGDRRPAPQDRVQIIATDLADRKWR